MQYKVYDDRIKIYDVQNIPKQGFETVIETISEENPQHIVIKNRTKSSMISELSAHKFLYKLGIKREHTKDCDINYPISRMAIIAYYILGAIG